MAQPGVKLTSGTLDVAVLNTTLAGTEAGLVVRTIPSGTQGISGTVGQGTAAAITGAWPTKLTDGTNTASITAGGSLNVNITGGAASGSTTVDETAYTAGTSSDTIIGGFYQTTATSNPLTNGQGGAVQLTINRAMHVNLRDAAGVAITQTGGSLNSNVTNTVTVTGTVALSAGSASIGTVGLNAGSNAIGSITNTSFIATQSTPGTHANYFWNRLTDGTNDVVVLAGGAIKVDGSAVTQPVSGTVAFSNTTIQVTQATGSNLNAVVSGTVTSNIGTTGGLALDATLTGGSGRFKITDGTNNAALTLETTYGLNVHINNATPIAVSMSTAAATTTTGSLAALNSTVSASVAAYDSALVTLKGTYAGVTVQFWLSDDSGTTYYQVMAVRTDINSATGSAVLSNNASTSYFVNVSGATNIQVKASAYTSGSVSVRISPNGSSFSTNLVAGLSDVSGNAATITAGGSLNANVTNTVTVTGTVALSAGAASIGTVGLNAGSNAIGSITNTTFAVTQATASALNATIVGTGTAGSASGGILTVQGVASMTALKVDGSGVTQPVSGTVAFSNSTIAVTQATASALNATIVGTGTAGTPSGGVVTVQGAASMTAIKVDGSAVTQPVSGTVAFSNTTIQVTQATGSNLNAVVTGTVTANLGTIAGVATAANQTNGSQLTQVSNGTNSAAVVNAAPSYNAYALVTRNIDSAASYIHLTTNIASTNAKSGVGLLKAVVINSSGDTGATLTIYDNTSGTASVVAVINISVTPVTLTYGLALATGLSYAITGVTSTCDVTILYA
jgi:hypothetical protein